MAAWQDFTASYGDTGAIGKLSGVHNSKLFDTMANQIAKAIGYTGKTWTPGTYSFENSNEGGTFTDTAQGKTASPEFLKALEAYQFQRTSPTQGAISDNAGQAVGTFTAGNKDTGFDRFAQTAIPVGLGLLAGGALGGYFPGAEVGAAGAGGSGTAGGLIGAGEGAAQLAAYTAANPLTAAGVTAATLPAAGLPGLTLGAAGAAGGAAGGLLAGEGAAQLAAYSAANPLTAAQVTASTLPAGGLPGLLAPAAGAATGAAAGASSAAPAAGNGAFLGEGVASGVPAWDAAAGSSIGLLGQSAAWMKANPLLGRLLMSGATTALTSMGGGGGGSSGSAPAVMPTPTKWNSPIQGGLLAPVQQYAPPAIQQNKPTGLLASGFQNDGAWRFMGG